VSGTNPRRRDRGAAVIWVLACGAVLMVFAVAVAVRTSAVFARHRAEAAADLAALAAAGQIGVGDAPCAAAAAIAQRNAAVVGSCAVALDPDGRSGTVIVRVVTHVRLPLVGTQLVTASARAGRLPGVPTRREKPAR
jgi:secretion/DNA translocation related TadE-like protein